MHASTYRTSITSLVASTLLHLASHRYIIENQVSLRYLRPLRQQPALLGFSSLRCLLLLRQVKGKLKLFLLASLALWLDASSCKPARAYVALLAFHVGNLPIPADFARFTHYKDLTYRVRCVWVSFHLTSHLSTKFTLLTQLASNARTIIQNDRGIYTPKTSNASRLSCVVMFWSDSENQVWSEVIRNLKYLNVTRCIHTYICPSKVDENITLYLLFFLHVFFTEIISLGEEKKKERNSRWMLSGRIWRAGRNEAAYVLSSSNATGRGSDEDPLREDPFRLLWCWSFKAKNGYTTLFYARDM